MCFLDDLLDSMQLGSSKDSFPCFTRLNPCVAHCSTDLIPWVLTLKGRRVPWLRGRICPLANPYELWYDNQPSTNTSVLTTIGSDFIMLWNTNRTPKVLLWTCYDSVLYVHVYLQKHKTSKCTYKDELVMSLVCLVAGEFHNQILTKV
jgi:hypothetical protein